MIAVTGAVMVFSTFPAASPGLLPRTILPGVERESIHPLAQWDRLAQSHDIERRRLPELQHDLCGLRVVISRPVARSIPVQQILRTECLAVPTHVRRVRLGA